MNNISAMTFFHIYLEAFAVIMIMMTLLWILSVFIKNVSIVDLFWGFGFVIVSWFYFLLGDGNEIRKIIIATLVSVWGLRLSAYDLAELWERGGFQIQTVPEELW